MNMNPKAVFLLFLLAITLSHSYRLQQIPYQHHPTTRCYFNGFYYICRPIYNPPYHQPQQNPRVSIFNRLYGVDYFCEIIGGERVCDFNQKIEPPPLYSASTPQRNQPVDVGRYYVCDHECKVVDAAGDCIWDLPCLIKMHAKKLRCGENVFI